MPGAEVIRSATPDVYRCIPVRARLPPALDLPYGSGRHRLAGSKEHSTSRTLRSPEKLCL